MKKGKSLHLFIGPGRYLTHTLTNSFTHKSSAGDRCLWVPEDFLDVHVVGVGEARFYRPRLLIDCPRATAVRARMPIEVSGPTRNSCSIVSRFRCRLGVGDIMPAPQRWWSDRALSGAFSAHEDRHHGRSGIDRDFSDQRSTSSCEHMICTRLRLSSLDISISSLLHIEAEKLGLDCSGSHLVKRCIVADVNNSLKSGSDRLLRQCSTLGFSRYKSPLTPSVLSQSTRAFNLIIPSTMKFFTSILSIALFAAASSATQVSYDETYDSSSTSLDIVSCSDGTNGLETKGFTTFGSLPKFPFIGGAQAVAGWNSPNCGTCWSLTYNGTTINVLAIDHAASGFNIAKAALDKLTNGHGVEFGVVQATATQVASSACGL